MAILKTRPENGASSEAARVSSGLGPGVEAGDRGDVGRGRQEVDDGVEERLDALVPEGGPVEDGDDLQGEGRPADGAAQLRGRDLDPVEVLLHQAVVVFAQHFQHVLSFPVDFLAVLLRDLADGVFRPQDVPTPVVDLAFDEVDDAAESVFPTQGNLDRQRLGRHPRPQLEDRPFRVGPDPVHLVDEHDPRHPILIGLAPHCLGLRFDAANSTQYGYRAVEHS